VADLIADSDQHRRDVANRVSFLFPRPETTEWSVREVGYDRTRRAEVSGERRASRNEPDPSGNGRVQPTNAS
jgi:hypothetical protein